MFSLVRPGQVAKKSVVNGFAEGKLCWVASSSTEKCSKDSFSWLVVATIGLVQP